MQSPSGVTRTTLQEADAWVLEAKRLLARGEHQRALALLQKSAEALPGRARVEHDTAELARRLGQLDLAVHHYRRASAAYACVGALRHAVTPLRIALNVEQSRLPASAEAFAVISRELAEALVAQGFGADARHTLRTSAQIFVEKGLPVPDTLRV
jgi:tetratricopeptide (TPR) repeat protein